MRKTTRSILQELNEITVNRNAELIIENRGTNLIQSAINLFELIRNTYDEESAAELERRFISSIRLSDVDKFKRNIRKIQERKNE